MPDIATTAVASAARAAAAASRVRPWLTVKRHNRLIAEEYEDLITWARDDLQEEARQLDRVRVETQERGLRHSGIDGREQLRVREEFSRRWRDRKRAAHRKFAALREAEGGTVKAWRRLRKKPWPENPWADELRIITAAWENEQQRRDAVQGEVTGFG